MLQLALDLVDKRRALKLAKSCAPYFDIIEAGTPLIKSCGIRVVRDLKRIGLPVAADLKTFDAGRLEAEVACREGADYVTVLALASDYTLGGFIDACRSYSAKSIADLMRSPIRRAYELERMGIDFLAVHSGVDEQKVGATPFQALRRLSSRVSKPLVVAGGIGPNNIRLAKPYASIIVVGSAVTSSKDPVESARLLRRRYQEI